MASPILLALPDLSPALVVEILPRGLIINRLLVNADGKAQTTLLSMVNVPTNIKTVLSAGTNFNTYANRLPASSYSISRDGAVATVQPIPNENPRSSLHGGPHGFDVCDWSPIDIAAASLFSEKEKADISSLPASALFSLVSSDGDQGFPGTLFVEVLFALSTGTRNAVPPAHIGSLYIVYRAKLLTKGITPINLTQHWGFNLDASLTAKGTPTPTILDHTLSINSDKTLALDEYALATGELAPVALTPRAPGFSQTRVGDCLPPSGTDAYYVFTAPRTPVTATHLPLTALSTLDVLHDIIHTPAEFSPLVELSSTRSGWILAFNSNQPGVQFYTANKFNGQGSRKPIHGWSGREGDGYGPHTFTFLEFHEPLAAWLHPATAPTGDTLLTSDELYNNFVRVDVLFRRPDHAEDDDD